MRTENIDYKNLLIEHNVRPSNYRIHILSLIDQKQNHPTADELYKDLIDTYPTLSKMSVYNNIEALVEAGLIRRVAIENTEVRYDSILDEHGHFKCIKCGCVKNFDLSSNLLSLDSLMGYEVLEKDVFFKGVCPDCQKL